MSIFKIFHTYTTPDTITNTNLNGDLNNIVTAGNAIDRQNMIAGAGIDASSMNPASAGAATFAGTQKYSFPPGISTGKEIDFTGTTVTSTQVGMGSDNGATPGMIVNVPTGSTNGAQLQVNGVTQAKFGSPGVALSTIGAATVNGTLQASPTINGSSVSSFVGPGYTANGTALGNTFHAVSGASNVFSGTINLSGAAVFSSKTTYAVIVMTFNPNTGYSAGFAVNVSGTQFTVPAGGGFTSSTFLAVGT